MTGPAGGIHRLRDAEKLALHRIVARYLQTSPERPLGIAKANLDRWLSTDPEVKPYFKEWQVIFATRSVAELVTLITADNEEGRRLRQTSPFVGVVTAEEREEAFAGARRAWEAEQSSR